jgi:cytochrome c553
VRILAFPLLVACTAGSAEPNPPPPPLPVPERPAEVPRDPVLPVRDALVRMHMHESFDLLRAIERLLIRGQLDEAKQFAHAIASAPPERGLGAFEPHAARVRERAAALALAKDVDAATERVSQLAAACAGCHAATGALAAADSYPAAPADEPTLEARMARHRWAADRMWEGIIADADEPWRAGLGVLASSSQWANDLGKERAGHARRLQQVAQAARRADSSGTPEQRAQGHGELLATCAGCHTGRPAP